MLGGYTPGGNLEVELIYQPGDQTSQASAVSKDAIVRVLRYLQSEPGRYTPVGAGPADTIDIADSASGLRATLPASALKPKQPLLPLSDVPGLAVIRKARVNSARLADYCLRVNAKTETPVDAPPLADTAVRQAFSPLRAGSGMLSFRSKRRYSFECSEGCIRVDVTAVRSLEAAVAPVGARRRDQPPTLADVSSRPEAYEIEAEWVGPEPLRTASAADAAAKALLRQFSVLLKLLDGAVARVMSVPEQAAVREEYAALARQLMPAAGRSGVGARFMGPKPVTLEARHLRCACGGLEGDGGCILHNYTATPKADGERRLLMVAADGRAYTVNDRSRVMDTGLACVARRTCVLDGEHVADSDAFLVFDAYVVDGTDVRGLPLMLKPGSASGSAGGGGARARRTKASARGADAFSTRLAAAEAVIRDLKRSGSYNVLLKDFRYVDDPHMTLADACAHLLAVRDSGRLPYGTDGIIFTPARMPVPAGGGTWPAVLKWKPPELNTIDFQVRIREDALVAVDGEREPRAIAELLVGQDPWLAQQVTALDFLSGAARRRWQSHRPGAYHAVPFAPEGGRRMDLCYLRRSAGGRLPCANGDEVFDGAVVEFAFDASGASDEDYMDAKRAALRWRPLRVRWDKLGGARGDVKANNAVNAAGVWRTIVRPIREAALLGDIELICEAVGEQQDSPEEYYVAPSGRGQAADDRGHVAMRRFHNHWIKRQSLLLRFPAASGLGRKVFDFGCGTGGDLNKWDDMGATDVMGVDKYASNLYNPDPAWKGAYMRLLLAQRQSGGQAKRVFLPVDASRPVATTDQRRLYAETMDESDRVVAEALWALADRTEPRLRPLAAYYGYAAQEFDLATCMFAIHYFFADASTLATFAANVASVLRPGGHFAGCCLDGDRVDALLVREAPGEGDAVGNDGWRIVRRYAADAPKNAFGRRIDVFMQSIGQQLPEFLVSHASLCEAMAAVGLIPPDAAACRVLGLPGGQPTGTFDGVYDDMRKKTGASSDEAAARMTDGEKKYSFLNRWFVFVKAGANPRA